MARTKTSPILKTSEVLLIVLFFVIGFTLPTAYANIAGPEISAPAVGQSAALTEAEAACQMIRATGRASECHVMDWNRSVDVIFPGSMADSAKIFCKETASAISSNFKQLAGKTWKVMVFSSGVVPPTAACRVT